MRPGLTPPEHRFPSVADAEQALKDQGFRLVPDPGIGCGGCDWIDATGAIEAGIYTAGKHSWDPECRIEYRPRACASADDKPAGTASTSSGELPPARDCHTPLAVALVAVVLAAVLPLTGAALIARAIASEPRQPCGGNVLAAILTDCEVSR